MKKLKLFYSGESVQLAYALGTSRIELLSEVRNAIGVENNAPLRFRDAEGNIVVISDSLPHEIQLHVSVELGFAPVMEKALLPPPLHSSKVFWELFSKNVALTNSQRFNEPSGDNGCYALSNVIKNPTYVIIDAMDKRGTRPCCSAIGAVDASLVSLPTRHINENDGHYFAKLMAVGQGPDHYMNMSVASGKPMRIGLYYNAGELTILNHDDPTNGCVRHVGLPDSIRFAFQTPKHDITVMLTEAKVPKELEGFKAPIVGKKEEEIPKEPEQKKVKVIESIANRMKGNRRRK